MAHIRFDYIKHQKTFRGHILIEAAEQSLNLYDKLIASKRLLFHLAIHFENTDFTQRLSVVYVSFMSLRMNKNI